MTDCIVIGGGIIGLLSALELRLAGLSVTVLEKNAQTGSEASWAGGGIISPLYPWKENTAVNQLVHWGQKHYPEFCFQLRQNTRIDPEYFRCGMLLTALPQSDIEEAKQWAKKHNVALQVHPKEHLKALEKNLQTANGDPVIRLPDIANIRNPSLLKSLYQYAKDKGINIHCHAPAKLIRDKKNLRRVQVHTAQQCWQAENVIVASGAWSQNLLPEKDINIRPVKGEMLLFSSEKPLLKHIIIHQGHYLIPRSNGHILAGSTLSDCGFNKDITAQARTTLYQQAIALLPQLEEATLEKQWAGLRPGVERTTPYIGKHPSFDNLFLNAGHFRNGFSMAPGSARLLRNLITHTPPIINPKSFSLPAQ